MSLPEPQIRLGDFELSAHPQTSTAAPGLHPDLGDDLRARDAALADDASGPASPPPPTGPTASDVQAKADVQAAIDEARARGATVTAGVQLDPSVLLHDPMDDLPRP